jgi:hypothetical protein
VNDSARLTGPSGEPARAGGKVAQFRLRLGSEKVVGCHPRAGSGWSRSPGPSGKPGRAGGPDRAGCLVADPKTHLTGGDA